MLSIVIQLGTILCLPIYFRRRIADFLATFPSGIRGDRTALDHPLTLTLLALLCTAVPAFLLSKGIGKNLESFGLMACSLIVGGVAIWVVDTLHGSRDNPKDVEAIRVGPSCLDRILPNPRSNFPGTSRSMAMIAGGELAGLARQRLSSRILLI
jgi:undecaprenyl-diphosphatase